MHTVHLPEKSENEIKYAAVGIFFDVDEDAWEELSGY